MTMRFVDPEVVSVGDPQKKRKQVLWVPVRSTQERQCRVGFEKDSGGVLSEGV